MDAELSLDKTRFVFAKIKSASPKWKEIGRYLGLSSETLQKVQANKGDEPEKALYAVIHGWLNGRDNAQQKGITWSILLRALKHKSVNEINLAVTLKKDLLEDSTSMVCSQPQSGHEVHTKHDEPMTAAEILKQHTSDLVEAISDAETYTLAFEFRDAGLIPLETEDRICTTKSFSRMERSRMMLAAIHKALTSAVNGDEVLQKLSYVLCQQENQSLVKIAQKLWKGSQLDNPVKSFFMPQMQYRYHQAIHEFQQCLKAEYISKSQQSVNAWPTTIAVEYVNLQIVEAVEASKSKQEEIARMSQAGSVSEIVNTFKLIDLKEIGKFCKKYNLIILEGAPGIGKTTVANKICQDWAKGDSFTEYELVIYIPLRIIDLKIANSLPDLLVHYSCYIDPKVIQYIRKTKGKGILFVLDGWDELNQSSLDETAFLPRFIKGDLFPSMVAIVTSRPFATRSIRSQSFSQSNMVIQIVGFTEDNIRTYVRLYFAKKPSVGEKLLEELHHYPNVMSACYVAINATIICYVYAAENQLPSTLTEVYHLFVLHAVKRFINKSIEKNEDELQAQSIKDFKQKRQNLILKLCDLALDGLLTSNFSFLRQTLRSSCEITEDEVFDGFGLVQFYDVYMPSGKISHSYFLHLTIQEFLAAYALNNKKEMEQFKCLGKIFHDQKHPLVAKFFSGLCQLENRALNLFLYTDEISQLLLIECVHESKNDDKCKEIAKRYKNSLCIKDRLQPYQALACGDVMLNSSEQWKVEWNGADIGMDELKIMYKCLKKAPGTLKSIIVRNSQFLSEEAQEVMCEIVRSQIAGCDQCKYEVCGTTLANIS